MFHDQRLANFVKHVLTSTEAPTDQDRYRATFGVGNSGMSFGGLQHDVRANPTARIALDVLLADAVERGQIDDAFKARVMGRTELPGERWMQGPDPFTEGERKRLDDVLGHDQSRPYIEDLDDAEAGAATEEMERVMEQMGGRPEGPGVLDKDNFDPEAVGLLAAWRNRTGDLNAARRFLFSEPGPLGRETVRGYLMQQKQFRPLGEGGRGENFDSWSGRVRDALSRPPTVAPVQGFPRGWPGGGPR